MDGLLYHMSNSNVCLSACTGSSPCKLNLSEAFFFFLLLLFHSISHLFWLCVSKSVPLSWLVFTSSRNIFIILPPVGACGPMCGPFVHIIPHLNGLVLTQFMWAIRREKTLCAESTTFSFLYTLHCLTSLLLFSLFFSFSNPIISWYLVIKSWWFYNSAAEHLPLPSSNFKK